MKQHFTKRAAPLHMKQHFTKAAALTLALLLALGAIPGGFTQTAYASGDATLTIIHINDTHGRTAAEPTISQMAKDLRAKGEQVLLLDGGDRLHGQVTANLTTGASMVELMNAVGYSAMVTGNHEYTYGTDRLLELAAMMDFPMLAANVKKDGAALFQPYEVFELDGLTVGVFGVATPETLTASDPRRVAGLVFESPAETAAAMVEVLKAAGCDIIIALAHLGGDQSSRPENRSDALAVPGVDVIIDGHSHTALEHGRMVGETLIAQAGEYAEHIGVVEIVMDGGALSKTARLVEVSEDLSADETITAKIAELDASTEDITSQIVGYTPVLLHGEREEVRTGETNLANLITDSMRHASGAEIGFIGGGSIRASIPAGDITMGDVLATMPFANLIVTMELRGAAVWEALEHGVSFYPEPAGPYVQISGLQVLFDPEAPVGERIKEVKTADGAALDSEKTYTMAMLEFNAAGGDGYDMLTSGQNLVYYGGDADAFVAYLATNPEISAAPENRLLATATPGTATDAAESGAETASPAAPEAAPVPPQTERQEVYIVQPGDYLVKIAEMYNTTWRELQRLNGIQNPHLIYPGQQIKLPAA